MLYTFQVFYPGSDNELRTVEVRAETADDACAVVEKAGVKTCSVGPGLPVVDWTKPTLNKQEAAAYLDVSETKIWELQAAGALPRPNRHGHSVFSVQTLERYRREHMKETQ